MKELFKDIDILKVFRKIVNKELLNDQDLVAFTKSYLKIKELEPYVEKIYINSKLSYDVENKSLYITSNKNCAQLKQVREEHNDNVYNLFVLFGVLHELRHVEQIDILNKNYKKEQPEKIKAMLYTSVYRPFYAEPNKRILEYDANIYSLKRLTELNKYLRFKDFSQISSILTKNIVFAYEKNTSPLEKNKINEDNWNNFITESNEEFCYSNLTSAYNYANKIKKSKTDLNSRILNGDTLTKIEIFILKQIETQNIITEDIFEMLEELKETVKTETKFQKIMNRNKR